MKQTRRTLIAGGAAALLAPALPQHAIAAAPGLIPEAGIAGIEARSGGRLGFAVLDTHDGRSSSWNGSGRFALSSTFKFLLAGAVLLRAGAGQEQLDRKIPVHQDALVDWSPVTERHSGGDMTVWALCEAAVAVSDNTAANLLLRTMGGPQGFTSAMRAAGSRTTRLDRFEPELNEAAPGDLRDTTTPDDMLQLMHRLLLDTVLPDAARRRLAGLLRASKTGGRRLRAGLPPDWQAGDKTGTGGNGAMSDIAILYPPGRAPVLAAAYFQDSRTPRKDLEPLFAELGSLTAAHVMR